MCVCICMCVCVYVHKRVHNVRICVYKCCMIHILVWCQQHIHTHNNGCVCVYTYLHICIHALTLVHTKFCWYWHAREANDYSRCKAHAWFNVIKRYLAVLCIWSETMQCIYVSKYVCMHTQNTNAMQQKRIIAVAANHMHGSRP